MWLNEEARIAQVANINKLPGTDGFTSPPKDAMMNTSSFLRVELSTLIREKSLTLVGLESATFRLQASTLTSRPLVPPSVVTHFNAKEVESSGNGKSHCKTNTLA